ncbi:SprB repeat-containing protein [Winogradskyella sediminis]|uniref:Por secretion system C-terminal sorting domain-containing protein n=1 Tax=Winogradskyella sediminis TaxID=1382466 RepID=A0A1H1XLQ5_9FLAO|nr:SprB repeat-containing protein [Winogradskyella sediminis]SDT10164.1 Por secretion system C-terminal sorting domain-containing protein [Winogradskyella sediminis]
MYGYTSSVTITEPAALVASSVVDSNASCNGGSDGSATASATGGTAPYTYLWSNAATTASIVGVVAGTYNVTITDANGCTDTSSVTITEPTALDISITQDSGVLTANQAGATYQWYACPNTLIVGETDQSFTPSEIGSYKVEITMGACVEESACEDVTVLGLEEVENNFKFSMYPNPSDRNVHITTSMDGYFQVINQLGQIIKTFKVDANIESTVYVGDLNNGFYFVKSVNNNFIQKLIVKK